LIEPIINIKIKTLKETAEFIPIIAHWAYAEWYKNRDISFNLLLKAYKKQTETTGLPLTQVAFIKDLPVGMVSLKKDQLWSNKKINPWLTSLYVHPNFRNMGVAKNLTISLYKEAKKLNFNKIYLFLDPNNLNNLKKFYLHLGWEHLTNGIDNDNKPTEIFFKKLPI